MFTLGVLTVSDLGARGERQDTSGQAIQETLEAHGFETRCRDVVPDERPLIEARLISWVDQDRLDLIITTGGTGLGPRDVTPEATLAVVERSVPGLPEAMRLQTLKHTPMAMLSRAAAGIRGRTLIVNLPGSPTGVQESLEVLLPVLSHALDTLKAQEQGHPR